MRIAAYIAEIHADSFENSALSSKLHAKEHDDGAFPMIEEILHDTSRRDDTPEPWSNHRNRNGSGCGAGRAWF